MYLLLRQIPLDKLTAFLLLNEISGLLSLMAEFLAILLYLERSVAHSFPVYWLGLRHPYILILPFNRLSR